MEKKVKRKILHVLSQKPEYTGSATFLQMLIKEGNKYGHEQFVIYGIPYHESGKYKLELPEENQFPVYFESEQLPFPVPGMSNLEPYSSTAYSEMTQEMIDAYFLVFKNHLKTIISKVRPDVIWSHHLWLVSSMLAELNTNIPLLTFCHATCLRQQTLAPKFKPYVVNNCRKIDKILVATKSQEIEVKNLFDISDCQIEIIGGAINQDAFRITNNQLPDLSEGIRLTYVGKICEYKGICHLLTVVKSLINKNYNFKLTLVGEGIGIEADQIKREAKKLGSYVELVGFVSQKKLIEILNNTHIFVFPSFFEGIGLVILEALACGCLIVVNEYENLMAYMPEKAISEGIVKTVRMPKMKSIDCPQDSEIPDYIERLTKAIISQMESSKIYDYNQRIEANSLVNEWTWESLFRKVNTISEEIIFENCSYQK